MNNKRRSHLHARALGIALLVTLAVALFQPDRAEAQNVTGSGTINWVPKWTGTSALGNSTIFDNGNIGIGTSSPGAKLEVGGNFLLKTAGPVSLMFDTSGTVDNRQFYFWNSNGHLIGRWVNDANTAVVAESITFLSNGKAGLGTTQPLVRLHVGAGAASPTTTGVSLLIEEGLASSMAIKSTSGAEMFAYQDSSNGLFGTASNHPLGIRTNNTNRLWIDAAGNVGIGTTSPTALFTVNGNVSVTGNITATGTVTSTYQDVAEWVPASLAIPAGTVVTIDPEHSNHVLASSHAYDTRVAGVVSARPGVILGEGGEGKVLVATTGRVRVKVDAGNGAIRVGDLLVTSDKEGIAMRSQPLDLGGTPIHRPGTLIGKALEPLEKGVGEILVLLSLQ